MKNDIEFCQIDSTEKIYLNEINHLKSRLYEEEIEENRLKNTKDEGYRVPKVQDYVIESTILSKEGKPNFKILKNNFSKDADSSTSNTTPGLIIITCLMPKIKKFTCQNH